MTCTHKRTNIKDSAASQMNRIARFIDVVLLPVRVVTPILMTRDQS